MSKKLHFILSLSVFLFSYSKSNAQSCLAGDCQNGMGTYLFANKDEYTGQFVNGELTGIGCFDWIGGTFYYGNFYKGTLDGLGFYFASESKDDQVGLFSNGVLKETRYISPTGCIFGNCTNGVGVYVWDNNDMYVGEWVNGNRSGYGRYDWANGTSYIGYIKNGLLHGWGDYIAVDKTHMTGQFVDNVFQGN